ncbi:50S ribosomal protein L23 [Candidatus Aerophobetes bacterium]|jgi:large subunit ribosomal protein L23|uniref:Large ribosomal subunit protein uL23 n=1 Tax=Aerophobetes bacterium TaxID=2030807 RepID=A0A523YNX7_UNCAE|nr:MAG: 50S ribosomal protein L23 [Candidatus Aerophobetes bacterium]
MNKLPQDIILSPVVSEKGTQLLKDNKYLFKVSPTSGKVEIKKAVEELFKVKVDRVRTMWVKGKRKKWRGRAIVKTANWKKAIVRLKEGETIEELGV